MFSSKVKESDWILCCPRRRRLFVSLHEGISSSRVIFWFMLMISTAFCAEKGSLNGHIIDKTTGFGLKDVNVVVMDTRLGAASSEQGQYHIDGIDPGLYRLQFSVVGYHTVLIDSVVIKPAQVTSIDVKLVPAVLQMNPIVVTAARRPQLLEQTPDVMIVQTSDEIHAMGAVQVDDIIEYMPGISSIGGTGSGQPFKRTVSINGMPASYSLILLDGRRVLSSHIHTGANVNIIPPEHIERIELVKGAMSAQYGTDGMGGVLNIITKKGTEQTRTDFTSYLGSQNTFHSGLSISGSAGQYIKHSFFSSWEQSDGQPIIQPIFRKGRLSYTIFHVMDRIDADISDNFKAGVSLHYMNTETPYRQEPQASSLFTPSLDAAYRITDGLTVQGSGYYSRWESQLSAELNEIASPELILSINSWQDHHLLFGAEYLYRNFARTRVSEHDQRTLGLFLQDDFSITPVWHILAALRLDKVENIEPVISPKISLLYHMNEHLSFRTSVGRGFRAPTVQDLYETLYAHPGDIHYRAGNPYLEPEYSTTLIAGIDWNLTDNFSLILNGYYYSIDNMITPVDHGLENPFYYFSPEEIPFVTDSLVYIYRRENIHRGLISGGEIKILWQLSPGYSVESGFSLTNNKNKETGESLPYYPGRNISLKIRGKQAITRSLEIGGFIGLNAVMDRKVWRFKRDADQQIHLDDYQNLDAGFSVLFKGGYEFFVNLENLLGQELNLYEDVDFITEGTPLIRAGLRLSAN